MTVKQEIMQKQLL